MISLDAGGSGNGDEPFSEPYDDGSRRSKLRRLAEASAKLAGGAVEIEQARFLPAVLCQVGLPRQKIGGQEFHRVNGQAELIIQAGHIERRGKLVPAALPDGVVGLSVRRRPGWLVDLRVTRNVPDDAENAGGLHVAVIQLANTVGASLGGYGFDLAGATAPFVTAVILMIAAAGLVLMGMSGQGPHSARGPKSETEG